MATRAHPGLGSLVVEDDPTTGGLRLQIVPAQPTQVLTATIANGQSLSGAVDLRGLTVIRIVMPATWTAANLTGQGSDDNSAWANLYDVFGNEYLVTAAASSRIIVPPSDLLGNGYLKLRSGTAATPVNQGGDRSIKLVARPL